MIKKNNTYRQLFTYDDYIGHLFVPNINARVIKPPSKKAKTIHVKYNVDRLIEYKIIDARSISYSDNCFDVVFMKSTLGYFKDDKERKRVIKEIYRVLKPGRVFLFAENMRGTLIHCLLRKYFVKWGKKWKYFTSAELIDLFSIFSYSKIKYTGLFTSFFLKNKELYRLTFLIDSFFQFLPNNWKYVSYGYLIK